MEDLALAVASRVSADNVDGKVDAGLRSSVRHSDAVLQALSSEYSGQPIDVSFRHLVGPLPANHLSHSIYPYPARLLRHIPRLLTRAPQLVGVETTIVDPFCGSGTVLLEAMSAGVRAIGVDANPLAALISSVKTTPLPAGRLGAAADELVAKAKRLRAGEPPAPFLKRWHSPRALSALSKIANALSDADHSPTNDALRLAFALTVRKTSATDERIPVPVRDHAKRPLASNLAVWSEFGAIARKLSEQIELVSSEWPSPIVKAADSRQPATWSEYAELTDVCVISSPPYGAAQKYLRSTSLELGWLGLTFGRGTAELERISIGREHLTRSDSRARTSSLDPGLRRRLQTMAARDARRAEIYSHYFIDMARTFKTMSTSMPNLRNFVLVAGDNTVSGESLPTHEYLARMLENLGFETRLVLRDKIRGRSLMSSRNNSGTPARAEFIYWLKR